ncbi:rSAM/selenodomain-associated transferase 1 [Pedobacter sp. UYEF25]
MAAQQVPVLVVEVQLQVKTNFISSPIDALIIFVRHPELGKVKTRLAASIGDEKALVIYQKLLRHTFTVTKPLTAAKFVFYAETIQKMDLWNEQGYWKCKQKGRDLGERMKHAFSFLFDQGFKRVIIIGSDCYLLTSRTILDAFEMLSTHQMVIGPAEDGGYYLLGMTKLYPEVFENKIWSTDQIAAQTIQDARKMGVKFSLLTTLSDVDEFDDLAKSGL